MDHQGIHNELGNEKPVQQIAYDKKILLQNLVAGRVHQKSTLVQFQADKDKGQHHADSNKANIGPQFVKGFGPFQSN